MEEPDEALRELLRLGVALAALLAREVAVIEAVTLVLPPFTSGFGAPPSRRVTYRRRGAGGADPVVVERWATQVLIPPFGGVAVPGGGDAVATAVDEVAGSATLVLVPPFGKTESPFGGVGGDAVLMAAIPTVTSDLLGVTAAGSIA